MKVVRYTFDVCFKNGAGCVYDMARKLENAIMKVDYVCGCETKDTHTWLANAVDVDKVIKVQNASSKLVGEEGGAK